MKKPYGKIKGDATPGVSMGKGRSLSMKMSSPYYKPKSVKTRSVKIKKRV